jgi:hypothetical protein
MQNTFMHERDRQLAHDLAMALGRNRGQPYGARLMEEATRILCEAGTIPHCSTIRCSTSDTAGGRPSS